MANNPKKVKDPTEVALSAIQEALNISDASTPDQTSGPYDRGSVHNDLTHGQSAFHAAYDEGASTPGRAPTGKLSNPPRSRARPAAPPMTTAKPSGRFCRPFRRAVPPATSIRSPRFLPASGFSAPGF